MITWTTISAVLIFVYTAIATYSAYLTYVGNDLNNRNLVYANRATVSLENVVWDREPNGLDFIGRWTNNGNTPTVDMQVGINYQLVSGNMPDGFTANDLGKAPYLPNARYSIPAKSSIAINYFVLQDKCLAQWGNGEKLYIWGRATYLDVSSIHHIARFCWHVVQMKIPAVGSNEDARASVVLCNEGNCTDDECYQHPVQPSAFMPPVSDCLIPATSKQPK